MGTYRIKIYGTLDDEDVAEAFEDIAEDSEVQVIEPSGVGGFWQVEFALRAPDEEAAAREATGIAEGLKFRYGQWDGIDTTEISAHVH